MRDSLPSMTGKTIAPPGRASSTAGMALDYRIRLFFEPPQVESLVAWAGATMAAHEILGWQPKGYRPDRDGRSPDARQGDNSSQEGAGTFK